MKLNRHTGKILMLIPAITIFFLALIPTLKYQWPLSWDIIYHIQYAKIYAHYGFVLDNPLIYPTRKIGYPPLFHFLLVFIASILQIDYFNVAKILQPVFAASIVLSVSYVAMKFYGKIAGMSAGFLIISSYLIHRIVLSIPENLALIFLPLAVYFYYISLKDGNLKYALISGLMLVLILLIHPAAPQILLLIVTAFTILALILNRDLGVLKNYGAFFVILIGSIAAGAIVLALVNPDVFYSIIQQGLNTITGYSASLNYNKSMSIWGYFGSLGIMVLIFTVIGAAFAIKKRHEKNLYIVTWILIMILLSKAYWFGINVISYRVLIYLLIPLSILGGFGLSQLYYRLKEYKMFSSRQFRSLFLICMFILCTFFGILNVENPNVAIFGATTEFGKIQIAPPTDTQADLANWFNENGDRNRSIITNNLFTGMFISSKTLMPFHYGFVHLSNHTPHSFFKNQNISYIVLDKRLTFPSQNASATRKLVNAEFYEVYFYSDDAFEDISKITPDYVKIVYENSDFIVCRVY